MRKIAVIPARGGSKRIPRKNIINFMGKPLIAWTVEAAIKFGGFDRVVVGTDDPEIANVAAGLGVEVPFLRTEANDDVTPVSIATIFTLQQAQEHWNETYDVVIQLMANCPMRDAEHISSAWDHFSSSNANFQLSCFKFGWMNPWWAATLDEKLRPTFVFPEALKTRSQDLPALYCPTGAIWIARTSELLREHTFYGEGHTFFAIDWKAAVDIDDYEDLDFAAAVFNQIHKDAI